MRESEAQLTTLRARIEGLEADLAEAHGIIAGLQDVAAGRVKALKQIDTEIENGDDFDFPNTGNGRRSQ